MYVKILCIYKGIYKQIECDWVYIIGIMIEFWIYIVCK